VPAGSGRTSGQWTSDGTTGSTVTEGRSAAAAPGPAHHVPELPNDAVVVTRPDGTTIDDPKSPTKKLMAPPHANFQEVYAAGEKIANWPLFQQREEARPLLEQYGTYDFQRDKTTNSFFDEYVPAANYAIGVYMAGAGYSLQATYGSLRGTPWVVRRTGTNTGREAGRGSRKVGRMAAQVIGKQIETHLHRPPGHPLNCIGRNSMGVPSSCVFSRHDGNGTSRGRM